jgi:CheY-like chemotaxis protein
MMTEGLSGEFFATHDVIVLNARGDAGTRAWTSTFGRDEFTRPVVAIAALGELKNLDPISKERPSDFVFSPWEAEEIAFRSGRLLSDVPRPASRRMVIIADDDPMVHTLLTAAFAKVNVECRSVHDGREALDAFRSSTPAAGILDIGMPRISGLTVLTELRKSAQTRGIPIMMLTAHRQKSEVGMALGFGANDYVVKPFDTANVVTRLLRLMA